MLKVKVFEVLEFIQKNNYINTSKIAKSLNIHYYKLMSILTELEREGKIKCKIYTTHPDEPEKRANRLWYIDEENKILSPEEIEQNFKNVSMVNKNGENKLNENINA